MNKTTIPSILWAATARTFKPGETTSWRKTMITEDRIEEIEPGVAALGAVYAAALISMIFWMAT